MHRSIPAKKCPMMPSLREMQFAVTTHAKMCAEKFLMAKLHNGSDQLLAIRMQNLQNRICHGLLKQMGKSSAALNG